MPAIVSPIETASHLQAAFREYDRDYYPYGVYEGLMELFEEAYTDEQPYVLDVIGLCCDIQEMTADDIVDDIDLPDDCDALGGNIPDEVIIDALTEQASEDGYLLWAGRNHHGELVAYYI